MNAEFLQIQQISTAVLGAVLKNSLSEDAGIKTLVSTELDGQPKQLLIVGNAHRRFNDANCIAILNPDESLVSKINIGVAYMPSILKEMVARRCDAMVQLQMIGEKSHITTSYQSRRRSPPVSSVG